MKLCYSRVKKFIFHYFETSNLYCKYFSNLKFNSLTSTNAVQDKFAFRKQELKDGPDLEYFLSNSKCISSKLIKKVSHPYINIKDINGYGKKVYFKVYGCQMNNNDANIAWSILESNGYCLASSLLEADIILIVTCAIRENAENKIWTQLETLRGYKNKQNKRRNIKIGVLGCMAERIGAKILERESCVDVVAGPDSYKDLPRLLAIAEDEKTINILLSHDETYAEVNPISLSNNNTTAFVSITRGCNNMCSYCIVPFTRGKERTRNLESIVNEVKCLSERGVKEVTLLGQNVNSYRDVSGYDESPLSENERLLSDGFKTIYKVNHSGRRFAELLDKVSLVDSEMRIRFTSPHPKDFPNNVLEIISKRPNICNHIHLPAQSGSSRILDLMQRGYTREAYINLVDHIRTKIPSVSITSDFICGFCDETEEEFEETLSLIRLVEYNFCFVFQYSMREKTGAYRRLVDNVTHATKLARLQKLNSTFREVCLQVNRKMIGERQLILIEGVSKRSNEHLWGRNDGNTKVIIPDLTVDSISGERRRKATVGDYVEVLITDASSQVIKATPISLSSISQFHLR